MLICCWRNQRYPSSPQTQRRFLLCSRKEQSQLTSKLKEYQGNQCVLQENKDSTSKCKCQAKVKEGDKNSQVNMQPVKLEMDMWSKGTSKTTI